jgi:hypothetical protein
MTIFLFEWTGIAIGLLDVNADVIKQENNQSDHVDDQSETERTHYHIDLKNEE